MRSFIFATLVTLACAGWLVTTTLGSSVGAVHRRSGGPAGFGQGCAACHDFHIGAGRVELLGAPKRYRPDTVYELVVRVTDDQRIGAGFEVSVEGATGHVGTLGLSNTDDTQFSLDFGFPNYVTHTEIGLLIAIDNWEGNGHSVDYAFRWRSPPVSHGPATVYVSGQAVDGDFRPSGDHFYSTYALTSPVVPGDADGDRDHDLRDWATLQRCFGLDGQVIPEDCAFVDWDDNGSLALDDAAALAKAMTAPTPLPPEYYSADFIRGGRLYDKWWTVAGVAAPEGNHPLYPPAGVRSGSGTFRCKECHGWDYKGVDGAYGTGSHFTGIPGIFGTALQPKEVFDLLRGDPKSVANGHGMAAYGMTEADMWDLVRMTLEGVVDTDDYIDAAGAFVGDGETGMQRYNQFCAQCHGTDGRDLGFESEVNPLFVGDVARGNPWETLHKIRFGHPASAMQGTELLYWPTSTAASIGAHSQTLGE